MILLEQFHYYYALKMHTFNAYSSGYEML